MFKSNQSFTIICKRGSFHNKCRNDFKIHVNCSKIIIILNNFKDIMHYKWKKKTPCRQIIITFWIDFKQTVTVSGCLFYFSDSYSFQKTKQLITFLFRWYTVPYLCFSNLTVIYESKLLSTDLLNPG